jgi:hypothetical protein
LAAGQIFVQPTGERCDADAMLAAFSLRP